jgi:hypothetical protein
MKKGDLLVAAQARDIAVTDADKKADIVDLLEMYDEDSSGEDDDDADGEEEGAE